MQPSGFKEGAQDPSAAIKRSNSGERSGSFEASPDNKEFTDGGDESRKGTVYERAKKSQKQPGQSLHNPQENNHHGK